MKLLAVIVAVALGFVEGALRGNLNGKCKTCQACDLLERGEPPELQREIQMMKDAQRTSYLN